jgi:hypothetical protein
LSQDDDPPRAVGEPLEHLLALLTERSEGLPGALPVRPYFAC